MVGRYASGEGSASRLSPPTGRRVRAQSVPVAGLWPRRAGYDSSDGRKQPQTGTPPRRRGQLNQFVTAAAAHGQQLLNALSARRGGYSVGNGHMHFWRLLETAKYDDTNTSRLFARSVRSVQSFVRSCALARSLTVISRLMLY